MGNEQRKKKRSSKKFWLYIQNGGDDIQKWVNLSTFWKILALGSRMYERNCNIISSNAYWALLHNPCQFDAKLNITFFRNDKFIRLRAVVFVTITCSIRYS